MDPSNEDLPCTVNATEVGRQAKAEDYGKRKEGF